MKLPIATLLSMLILGILNIQNAFAEAEETQRLLYDQQKCDAALADLPKAIAQVRNIKIAGFTTEPLACVRQEILNQCQVMPPNYVACKIGESMALLSVFETVNNGYVITSVEYKARLETDGEIGFFPYDVAYKSLIARYGEPAQASQCCFDYRNLEETKLSIFRDIQPPYKYLVWANGAVLHYANKESGNPSDNLKIYLGINLSKTYLEKISAQVKQRNDAEEAAQKQEAASKMNAPKF